MTMHDDAAQERKVFIPVGASACGECHQQLERGAWICLAGERGALCLSCADLDHLVYLPRGDAALTRRAKTHSALFAVVLQWSRARKQYERQGLLVERAALDRAEAECLADADARERRAQREAERRAELDPAYIAAFARRVRELFPACPAGRELAVAEHACEKYSGRVGRSAAAKTLDEQAVRLAVVAHVRHTETDYDKLLAAGRDRYEARREVESRLDSVLASWEQ